MSPIEHHFNALDAFLLQWQWIWCEVPFKQPALSWFERHPDWKLAIDAIDDAQLQRLALDADALYTFARHQLHIDIGRDFYRINTATTAAAQCDNSRSDCDWQPEGISTRKWRQICAFSNALLCVHENNPAFVDIVEWCAGKGHLSRTLLQQHVCSSAIGLEWNAGLIESGSAAARRDEIALHLQQQNVLDNSVAGYCTPPSHHIALHACGKLHISMLRHCGAARVSSIDLVPCCYHIIDEPIYQPLSRRAQQSTLRLDDDALKLALQETVTAPANARRHRARLQRWRLGFDALQREVRGADHYLPVPSFAGTALASFRDFCAHCAALKQLELPDDIDHAYFEAQGIRRFDEVSRYDLLRQLFRRPVELWLALDRCLFLVEQGYDVELTEFCARELTPRNLWIHAHRRDTTAPETSGTAAIAATLS